MINNHILAMSGAAYWLGAIFFWKIMEFFITFEWFLKSSSPHRTRSIKVTIHPSPFKINSYLKNIFHWFFFLILSYDVHEGDHSSFLFIFFILFFFYCCVLFFVVFFLNVFFFRDSGNIHFCRNCSITLIMQEQNIICTEC